MAAPLTLTRPVLPPLAPDSAGRLADVWLGHVASRLLERRLGDESRPVKLVLSVDRTRTCRMLPAPHSRQLQSAD